MARAEGTEIDPPVDHSRFDAALCGRVSSGHARCELCLGREWRAAADTEDAAEVVIHDVQWKALLNRCFARDSPAVCHITEGSLYMHREIVAVIQREPVWSILAVKPILRHQRVQRPARVR